MAGDDTTSTSTPLKPVTPIAQYQCPKLKTTNYTVWAIQIKVILEAYDLWEAIEPKEDTQVDNKKDKATTAFLYQALTEDVILQVAGCETAKELWDSLTLGLLAYYLGIEVTQTGGEITIKQTGYINKILKDTSMTDSNDTKIPMDPGTKLVKAEDGNLVDATYYRSLIGSLRYLLHTRPDLSYAVGLLSRFMQDPKEIHLKAVKQVIRYIKGTKEHGIIYM
ncbi:ribonuclease H-like domain, reverse transcriptase, RNA-dependent DNA polymerase [Tanacetum coccineum]